MENHYYANPSLLSLNYLTDVMFSNDGEFKDHRLKEITIEASKSLGQERQYPEVPTEVGIVINPPKDNNKNVRQQCVHVRTKHEQIFTVTLDITFSSIEAVKKWIVEELSKDYPNLPISKWSVKNFKTNNIETQKECAYMKKKVLDRDGYAPVLMSVDKGLIAEMPLARITDNIGHMFWDRCEWHKAVSGETCEMRARQS
jgi:hypothetical protein